MLFNHQFCDKAGRLGSKADRFGGKAGQFGDKAGQSVVEFIVAMAIFIIIAATAMTAILGSFSSSRLAKEEDRASFLATQGIEAVQSIRNQDWANLVNGTYGLSNAGGVWSFSGSFDTDPSGNYTRVVTISDIYRDGNGDITQSGGTIDDDSKQAQVAVTWNFTVSRQNTVTMSTYLTNWQYSRSQGSTGSEGPVTCDSYCQGLGYSAGTCRQNAGRCSQNSETHESSGDSYCTGGPAADTCCCAP